MKKNIIFILVTLLTLNCSKSVENKTAKVASPQLERISIPDTTVDLSKLKYDNKVSLWTLNGQLFSGYVFSNYPDGTTKETFSIFQGRKQNEAVNWYPDGHIQFSSFYYKGKLHGEKKAWSSDSSHTLVSHLNYHLGKVHGVQKKWYVTGELFKVMHLNMGKEEGIQQAFRKNGVLYVNYEAKKGRIFGMKKAALCYELDNEQVLSNTD